MLQIITILTSKTRVIEIPASSDTIPMTAEELARYNITYEAE